LDPENSDAPEAVRGKRLRRAREDVGQTREQLADLLGVTAKTIFNYETGAAKPRAEVYELLASLGADARWLLLGGSDPPPPAESTVRARAPTLEAQRAVDGGGEAPPSQDGGDEEDEVEEFMRALSFAAEVRLLYGTGPVTVQLVMTAAQLYGKLRSWPPEKLERLGLISRILEENFQEATHEERPAASSVSRRDTGAH
jgi:transcriptional regulator with XRE-family HTH domain